MDEIHVVGAAIRSGDRVMAAQRSAHMNSALKWEFPGGKIEKGESHQEALCREIQEELGLVVEVKEYIATGYSEVDGRRILLYIYEAEIKEGQLVLKEHAQVKWVEISRIMELDWAEADVPACEELQRKYR